MKIHFIAELKGNKKDFQKILNLCKKLGYQIITDHMVTRDIEDVKKETPKESAQYFEKMNRWIKQADIVIVEATYPGFSIGFESALALKYYDKPVIILYKPRGFNAPFAIKGLNVEKLQILPYEDNDLEKTLNMALNYAHDRQDVRFTMVMPSDINQHLDKIIQKSNISRSEYIRNLIIKDMGK